MQQLFQGLCSGLWNIAFEVALFNDCDVEAALLREVNVVFVGERIQIIATFFLKNPQLFGDVKDMRLINVNLRISVEFGVLFAVLCR